MPPQVHAVALLAALLEKGLSFILTSDFHNFYCYKEENSSLSVRRDIFLETSQVTIHYMLNVMSICGKTVMVGIIFSSPAPLDIKRPRLSCPTLEEESENIIVAETPSPKPRKQEPKSELTSIAEE